MSTTFPHFQDTLYSGICAVNIPAPKMSPWQQSPAQHPPRFAVSWWGQCCLHGVLSDQGHPWPAVGRQDCSRADVGTKWWSGRCSIPWGGKGGGRGTCSTVVANTGVGRELLPWPLLHLTGTVQIQQHLLLSREPFWSQQAWYSILLQGRAVQSLGCCACKAWSCLGDACT